MVKGAWLLRGERDFIEPCRDGGGWSLLLIAFVGFLVFVASQKYIALSFMHLQASSVMKTIPDRCRISIGPAADRQSSGTTPVSGQHATDKPGPRIQIGVGRAVPGAICRPRQASRVDMVDQSRACALLISPTGKVYDMQALFSPERVAEKSACTQRMIVGVD